MTILATRGRMLSSGFFVFQACKKAGRKAWDVSPSNLRTEYVKGVV